MTYRELQKELRIYKKKGWTAIKLNAPKAELQAEYDAIQEDLKETDKAVERVQTAISETVVHKTEKKIKSEYRFRDYLLTNFEDADTEDAQKYWSEQLAKSDRRLENLENTLATSLPNHSPKWLN